MTKILVVGSISTDFVVTTNKRPDIGETVEGNNFETSFGGKGANQAIVSSRLGADTTMVGAVGGDIFGRNLVKNLKNNQINTKYIETISEIPSGTAVITISEGDNSIIYVPGANNFIKKSTIINIEDMISESDIVMVQNETPEDAVNHLIEICYSRGVPIIYDPAPAREVDDSIIEKVTYLTPNESEAGILFPNETIEEALNRYPEKLIITRGSKGALINTNVKITEVPTYKTEKILDSTGAGDTFNGAFAVAITSGLSFLESVKFSNLVSSLSIQKEGAQAGVPTIEKVKQSKYYDSKWL